jgi:MFS transporter, MHS family, proline/betaine transporter
LIFPKAEPITALILTYAMIPLGMIARPLGAFVFGYIGDSFGRKKALILSLGSMSVVTGLMALSPTYAYAGMFAPLFLCNGIYLQNFLSAGETMGGAIYLLENTSEERHDVLSGFYSATTIGGILFASAGVALLSQYGVIEWGWRLLYLVGCLTAFFAFTLRKQLPSNAWDDSPTKTPESLLHSKDTPVPNF